MGFHLWCLGDFACWRRLIPVVAKVTVFGGVGFVLGGWCPFSSRLCIFILGAGGISLAAVVPSFGGKAFHFWRLRLVGSVARLFLLGRLALLARWEGFSRLRVRV